MLRAVHMTLREMLSLSRALAALTVRVRSFTEDDHQLSSTMVTCASLAWRSSGDSAHQSKGSQRGRAATKRTLIPTALRQRALSALTTAHQCARPRCTDARTADASQALGTRRAQAGAALDRQRLRATTRDREGSDCHARAPPTLHSACNVHALEHQENRSAPIQIEHLENRPIEHLEIGLLMLFHMVEHQESPFSSSSCSERVLS
jgi:hypothetical protein